MIFEKNQKNLRKSIDSELKICYIILAETQERRDEIMFNQNLLKAKIVEKGISIAALCNKLGICEATYYRKLSRNGDFSRHEISIIVEFLQLTLEERNNIFFDNKLT